ncbi:MAG: HAMP domain-containing histidine kinase [Candidatus Eremiobacteraeota bacterium]|nr:HAMP domain-containing histidine kinase [Candidatus Eremiobacteraeota bacterium]
MSVGSVESLERTMLALSDAREVQDVFAVAARSLARSFRRRCVAYELRDSTFKPVVASDGSAYARPIVASDVDLRGLRLHVVVRRGADDLVGVTSDGHLRGLLVLEDAEGTLGEVDVKHLRAVASHVSLALASALAFDQLRRYAAEGAALGEAAKTILAFTALEPLAESLCRLAVRLVQADWAAMYDWREGEFVRVAWASARGGGEAPVRLPADCSAPTGVAAFTRAPHIVVPLAAPCDQAQSREGLLVACRAAAFEKPDLRLVDALATLAALALRNVDWYEQSVRANRALAESNAFKDDLMAMFAHDFRGPLTVISGYSELLLASDDADVRRSARTIVEQARRLANLSEDALALAATQSAGFSLQRKREDLTGFVNATAAALDPGGVRVVLEAPVEPVLVSFDRARLRHVVENVLGNALKYSSREVTVRVSVAGESARIDVSDSGIGIPAGETERIFARFGRASNAAAGGATGSGVGLYIAKKIVEVHGGRLEVESAENRGSTFTVMLPL